MSGLTGWEPGVHTVGREITLLVQKYRGCFPEPMVSARFRHFQMIERGRRSRFRVTPGLKQIGK